MISKAKIPALIALAWCLALTGCGNKGPLTKAESKTSTPEAVPEASAKKDFE